LASAGADRAAEERGIDGRPQIRPVTGTPVARPRIVELAPVDQLAACIEQEEIGRAGSLICLGDLLRSS